MKRAAALGCVVICIFSTMFLTACAQSIVGIWVDREGETAFEFYENGDVDAVFAGYSATGYYHVKKDVLSVYLKSENLGLDDTVEYTFEKDGDTLTLRVADQVIVLERQGD